MFNFFKGIAELISTVGDAVVSFVKNIILIFKMITQGFAVSSLVVAYLPDILVSFVILFVAYAICINLINKGG